VYAHVIEERDRAAASIMGRVLSAHPEGGAPGLPAVSA